jgi:transposase
MTTATALDPTTLPDDPSTLKKMLLEITEKLQQREGYIQRLQHLLARFRRWQFGAKSERVPDGQQIFDFYGTLEPVKTKEDRPEAAPRARTRPKRGGYRVIPKDLPQKVVTVDLEEHEKNCPRCGALRRLIGYEETRQLDHQPASFFEIVTRRAKYACDPCEGHLQTAPLPVPLGPIEKGLPGFGLLAQVLVAKYCDHLPLYRQSKIYLRHGVEIPRSTLCNWVGQAVLLLEPIVKAMREDVLLSRIVGTDDTVVRMLVPGLGRTVQARLWGYLGDPMHNQMVYEFTPDRKQEHPIAFLENFKGKIQADAYKGYDRLFLPGSERTELGCWAHDRRYWFDARDTDPQRASVALGYIRLLYQVEAEAAPLTPAQRLALRRGKSLPILEDFKKWLDQESYKVLPQSPIGEAFHYTHAQWEALIRYVEDGEASIDNNAVERGLRGVAIGRKNFLFAGSEAGGRWMAVAYSLIESCKLNGVDPHRYLKDVLRRVWTHPSSKIDQLMPRLWKPPSDTS